MGLTAGDNARASEVINIKTYNLDGHIDASGKKMVLVDIENVTQDRNVFLRVRGLTSDMALPQHLHGVGTLVNGGIGNCSGSSGAAGCGHNHTISGSTANSSTDTIINGTNVPQGIQIWIDGVDVTATIGDQNGRGASEYDSVNDNWGVDGTTEWQTGKLDISSAISWTAGVHTIEIRGSGETGGRIVLAAYVNNLS